MYDEEYARKVIPYLKESYFPRRSYKIVLDVYTNLLEKYTSIPTIEAIIISIEKVKGIDEEEYDEVVDFLNHCKKNKDELGGDREWLIDETEQYCIDSAIYNAIKKSIRIADGEEKDMEKGQIPDLLSDALSVSFDNSIGHDYMSDYDERYEFYHEKSIRVPTGLEMLDKITKGGFPLKTLNILLAGTGVGKSLYMCHLAAAMMMMGKNVLYITLELAEERVAERIDANLLNVELDDLSKLSKPLYQQQCKNIRDKTVGNLVIKEYPTASAHVGHFRHLLRELKIKKKFVPNIIMIDYINICASSRIKGGATNSYTLVKSIAEELRGLAVEFSVPIISATQTNREGYSNSDPGLENTSESFGLPATSDTFFAAVTNDELAKMGKILIKQLKNRFSDININNKFMLGIDKPKMRLYNLEEHGNLTVAPKNQEIVIPEKDTKSVKDKFDTFNFDD